MKLKPFLMSSALLLATVPSSISFAANADPAKAALNQYLIAAEQGNVSQMVQNSSDKRIDPTQIHTVYQNILSQERDQLSDFVIQDEAMVSPAESKFIAKLSFKDGHETQVPFDVIKDHNTWKVNVTLHSLENSDFKVLKQTMTPQAPAKAGTIAPAATSSQVCNWNFSARAYGSVFYSIQTFTVSNPNSQVMFNLQQWNDSSYGATPNIHYEVVIQHWYGDDVWGGTWAYGTIHGSANQYYVTGKSNSFGPGAQIRFTTDTASAGNTFAGFGELYN